MQVYAHLPRQDFCMVLIAFGLWGTKTAPPTRMDMIAGAQGQFRTQHAVKHNEAFPDALKCAGKLTCRSRSESRSGVMSQNSDHAVLKRQQRVDCSGWFDACRYINNGFQIDANSTVKGRGQSLKTLIMQTADSIKGVTGTKITTGLVNTMNAINAVPLTGSKAGQAVAQVHLWPALPLHLHHAHALAS